LILAGARTAESTPQWHCTAVGTATSAVYGPARSGFGSDETLLSSIDAHLCMHFWA
jgi:hypothetical protein